ALIAKKSLSRCGRSLARHFGKQNHERQTKCSPDTQIQSITGLCGVKITQIHIMLSDIKTQSNELNSALNFDF
ncbi:MAG: hypothetical protein M3O03_15030, partial [Pseudomonadota bacterium]|nr:hypothetical protein [Pseudomonadota bacterium]